MTTLTANPPPPPTRLKRLKRAWGLLGSSSWVGFIAVLAFVLSVLQAGWPWVRDLRAPYVRGVTPDLVNLFCEGTEGIDVRPDTTPLCDANSKLVVMVTPLSYINEARSDKTVWLRREFVKVTFEDAGRQPYKPPFVLFWERVKSLQDWQPPAVVQLKAGDTTSHSTLFYPSSLGCNQNVQWQDCLALNSYGWSDFANDVISGHIKYVVLDFNPEFLGLPQTTGVSVCEVILDDSHKKKLEAWREHHGASDQGTSAYLSAQCVERLPAG